MKKKILLILVTLVAVFSLTGCAKTLKNSEKQAVKNPDTGQNLVSNILCQPDSETTLNLYKENNIDITKLPSCPNFKVTSGGYEGVWTSIFVKPLAWVIVKIGAALKSYGLALVLITILIRLALYPFTKKATMQSELMKEAKPALDKLEQKYKGKTDQDSTMKKSQEMMAIYKKYNISPLSGCLFSFIQIPLFFAFYEAINRLPAIFEENFLGIFQLGTTPLTALSTGRWYYLVFAAAIIATTYFSFKMSSADMSGDQQNQMKMMSRIMVVFISIASFSLSTGVAFYWITNSGCTILQNVIVKRRKKA